jgi:hypothetical protein
MRAASWAHNIHARGYEEEGTTTTTPFDMVMLNGLDRFHLVMDVIDRIPFLGSRAAPTSATRWRTRARWSSPLAKTSRSSTKPAAFCPPADNRTSRSATRHNLVRVPDDLPGKQLFGPDSHPRQAEPLPCGARMAIPTGPGTWRMMNPDSD